MKLRLVPVLITSLLSALLLFGGFYGYRQLAVKDPLEKIVSAYEGVNSSQVTITQSNVTLKLDLEPGTKLRELVQYVNTEGRSAIGNRALKLNVDGHTSVLLDQYWDSAMFSVAEAMEGKQYTLIPDELAALKKEHAEYSNITVSTEIDDTNVYVSLSEGEYSKFIILPRTAQTMGVWNNA